MTYFKPKNVTFIKTKTILTYFKTYKLPFSNWLTVSHEMWLLLRQKWYWLSLRQINWLLQIDLPYQYHTEVVSSSIARGGYSPPIGMSTKMQIEKNTTFLALLRLFYALEWTKQKFKTSFETYIQGGGANFSKIKLTNKWKLWKTVKNKQSNLIASEKMLNIGVINKYIIN